MHMEVLNIKHGTLSSQTGAVMSSPREASESDLKSADVTAIIYTIVSLAFESLFFGKFQIAARFSVLA